MLNKSLNEPTTVNNEAIEPTNVKFEEGPYLSNLCESIDDAKDLCSDIVHITNGYLSLYSNNEEDFKRVQEIANLPIYRGYIVHEGEALYADIYRYEDKLYSERELTELLKTKFRDVDFAVVYEKEEVHYDEYTGRYESEFVTELEPFPIGIVDLFNYQSSICGFAQSAPVPTERLFYGGETA